MFPFWIRLTRVSTQGLSLMRHWQDRFRNEQEFPDQKLQRMLVHTNLLLNGDGAKLKKQQFHAKLELDRRQKECSSWKQQVELSTCIPQICQNFGPIALVLLHSADCMLHDAG